MSYKKDAEAFSASFFIFWILHSENFNLSKCIDNFVFSYALKLQQGKKKQKRHQYN